MGSMRRKSLSQASVVLVLSSSDAASRWTDAFIYERPGRPLRCNSVGSVSHPVAHKRIQNDGVNDGFSNSINNKALI
jgi:hypothetical protein